MQSYPIHSPMEASSDLPASHRSGSLGWFAFAALGVLVASVIHVYVYSPRLPDQVASHFDGNMRADGYSSKASLLTIYVVLQAAMAAGFVGGAWLIKRMPARLVNMPNKEYWLAPERREESLLALARWTLAFGTLTLLFVALVMHIVFVANLHPERDLAPWFWLLLGGYLVGTLVFLAVVLVRFGRAPKAILE